MCAQSALVISEMLLVDCVQLNDLTVDNIAVGFTVNLRLLNTLGQLSFDLKGLDPLWTPKGLYVCGHKQLLGCFVC